jgi:hypothetical protein
VIHFSEIYSGHFNYPVFPSRFLKKLVVEMTLYKKTKVIIRGAIPLVSLRSRENYDVLPVELSRRMRRSNRVKPKIVQVIFIISPEHKESVMTFTAFFFL